MKTIPHLHGHAVYDVLALAMVLTITTFVWSILAAVHVYNSTCTIVSYQESPYTIPVSDKPWEGEVAMVRIKVCIFEDVYTRATVCDVVHDGAPDPQFQEYYALGTPLKCKTAPLRLYTRILGADAGNGVWMWKHGDPGFLNIMLWVFLPLTLISLIACWVAIEYDRIHKPPEDSAYMMHDADVVSVWVLFLAFFGVGILSVSAIGCTAPRACEVTHSWIRPALLGDDMMICVRMIENAYPKNEHGCVSVPYGELWKDPGAALDYYSPGTLVACTVNGMLPMNRMTAVLLTNLSDYSIEKCSGSTWVEAIRAVPSSQLLWTFSSVVCTVLAAVSFKWLVATDSENSAKKRQAE